MLSRRFVLFCWKKLRLWYSLEPPRRGGSHEYPQSMFWEGIWKIFDFFLFENNPFLVVKFSIYLNRRVFVVSFLWVWIPFQKGGRAALSVSTETVSFNDIQCQTEEIHIPVLGPGFARYLNLFELPRTLFCNPFQCGASVAGLMCSYVSFYTWHLFCHCLFLISSSVGSWGELCLVIVGIFPYILASLLYRRPSLYRHSIQRHNSLQWQFDCRKTFA